MVRHLLAVSHVDDVLDVFKRVEAILFGSLVKLRRLPLIHQSLSLPPLILRLLLIPELTLLRRQKILRRDGLLLLSTLAAQEEAPIEHIVEDIKFVLGCSVKNKLLQHLEIGGLLELQTHHIVHVGQELGRAALAEACVARLRLYLSNSTVAS